MFVGVWSLLYILYIGGNVLKDKFKILHYRVTKLVFIEYYYQYFVFLILMYFQLTLHINIKTTVSDYRSGRDPSLVKCLKGAIVNRTCHSINVMSHKITPAGPLLSMV